MAQNGRVQARPESYRGICIPRNIYNFNNYFQGAGIIILLKLIDNLYQKDLLNIGAH